MHINNIHALLLDAQSAHHTPHPNTPQHVTQQRAAAATRAVPDALSHSTLATATVALPSLTVVLSCCGCRPSVCQPSEHRRRTRISLAQQVLEQSKAALPSRRTETAVRFHLCILCQTQGWPSRFTILHRENQTSHKYTSSVNKSNLLHVTRMNSNWMPKLWTKWTKTTWKTFRRLQVCAA